MDGRLKTRDCFFAVKKDVDKIKRKDFKKPRKDDEYSTSVLGIQFTRTGMTTVEIISRYNHTVINPNCTLGNDLNKLAPGLENSFANLLLERGLVLNSLGKQKFEIPGYTVANDGKYYKYNMEINGEYYCPGNLIISGGKAKSIAKPEEGLLIDHFYIDKKAKTIKNCINNSDSFIDGLQRIEKIEVEKSDDDNVNRLIKIYMQDIEEPAIIGISKDNQIVKYENNNIVNIGYNFLSNNESLTEIKLPKLEEVRYGFLSNNKGLIKLELLNLKQVRDGFLQYNEGLIELKCPQLEKTGDGFLRCNKELTVLEAPKLKEVRDNFLSSNKGIIKLKLQNLKQVGDGFLYNNEGLTILEAPKLKEVGDNFLNSNEGIVKLELLNLEQVGRDFLRDNEGLVELKCPQLEKIRGNFLIYNKGLTELEAPKLKEAGDAFLYSNEKLTKVELPNLEQAGRCFLNNNKELTELNLPKMPELIDAFSSIINSNTKKQKCKKPKTVTSQDIAKLDKDNKLTTTEESWARKIIERLFKRKDEKER